MPLNQFLEQYPLYRKLDLEKEGVAVSSVFINSSPPIHMECRLCKTDRTFNPEEPKVIRTTDIWKTRHAGGGYRTTETTTIFLTFICAACRKFERTFTVYHNHEEKTLEKIGQNPSWTISIDQELAKALGPLETTYRKGLICESQSFGIGAYSYYRRIIEIKIDSLLTDISKLLDDEKKGEYNAALEQVRKETQAAKKIELVKELLPGSLRPQNLNPLDILYGALSEGIHSMSDEECLELAGEIKHVMSYLIQRIGAINKETASFTSGMRKILEKRRPSAKK
jgi:hypothetical protein